MGWLRIHSGPASRVTAQQQGARELRAWFDAYREVGFSHEEALRLCCRSFVVLEQPNSSPEWSELATKLSAMLNRELMGDSE